MSDIKIKTLGELIDSLITTSMRCWNWQEKIMDEGLSEQDRLQAAIQAQEQNAKRSALIGAINELMGQEGFTANKTYTYFKDKK